MYNVAIRFYIVNALLSLLALTDTQTGLSNLSPTTSECVHAVHLVMRGHLRHLKKMTVTPFELP